MPSKRVGKPAGPLVPLPVGHGPREIPRAKLVGEKTGIPADDLAQVKKLAHRFASTFAARRHLTPPLIGARRREWCLNYATGSQRRLAFRLIPHRQGLIVLHPAQPLAGIRRQRVLG